MGHERSLIHSFSLRGEKKKETIKQDNKQTDNKTGNTLDSKAWAMKEV